MCMGRSKLTVLCLGCNRANNRTSAHTAHARNFEIARAQGAARIRAVPPTHPHWHLGSGRLVVQTARSMRGCNSYGDSQRYRASPRRGRCPLMQRQGMGIVSIPAGVLPRPCQGQGSGPCPSARSCHGGAPACAGDTPATGNAAGGHQFYYGPGSSSNCGYRTRPFQAVTQTTESSTSKYTSSRWLPVAVFWTSCISPSHHSSSSNRT